MRVMLSGGSCGAVHEGGREGVTKGGSVKGCHEMEWCHEEGAMKGGFHEREVL